MPCVMDGEPRPGLVRACGPCLHASDFPHDSPAGSPCSPLAACPCAFLAAPPRGLPRQAPRHAPQDCNWVCSWLPGTLLAGSRCGAAANHGPNANGHLRTRLPCTFRGDIKTATGSGHRRLQAYQPERLGVLDWHALLVEMTIDCPCVAGPTGQSWTKRQRTSENQTAYNADHNIVKCITMLLITIL